MTTRQLIDKYCDYSYSELRNIILSNTPESEEAAYYLLRYKMENEMSYLYSQFALKDELGDVLMDFLLYLRNGKAGNNTRPYQGLEGIFSMLAFRAWVKRVYRNFLVDRSNRETRSGRTDKEYGKEADNAGDVRNDEQIRMISILIAWMIQETTPNERFLFFRHLLHTMCKVDVIPSARMATAMGISHGTYRTRDSRINAKMQILIQKLQGGKRAVLTPTLSALAHEIYDNFDDLTSIIKRQYELNLEKVDNNLRIQEERQQDLAERKWELEEKAKLEDEWQERCQKIQSEYEKQEAKKKAEHEKAQKETKKKLTVTAEADSDVRYSLKPTDSPEIRYSLSYVDDRKHSDAYNKWFGMDYNAPTPPKPMGPILPPKPKYKRKPVSPKEIAQYTKQSPVNTYDDDVAFDFLELCPRSLALKIFKATYLTE